MKRPSLAQAPHVVATPQPEHFAPDGTHLEVSRNHGKPMAAQQAALKLAQERLAQMGSSKASPPRMTRGQAKAQASSPAADRLQMAQTSQIPTGTSSTPSASSVTQAATAEANVRAAKPAKRLKATAGLPRAEPSPPPAPTAETSPSMESPEPAAAPAAPKRKIQVRFTGMKPMHVVEAALFSAGKPVGIDEIAESTGLPPESVKAGIKELQKEYEARDTVLEVGKAGTKWGMQVKTLAAEPAAKFAPMEIPAKVLKTLALIAYHQPMKQSELVEMMGSKVYDHVPELVQRGLIRAREEGATKILVTTTAFPEYFGLDAENPEEIRAVMGKLVGIVAPPKEKPSVMRYEETPEPASAPAASGTEDQPPQS